MKWRYSLQKEANNTVKSAEVRVKDTELRGSMGRRAHVGALLFPQNYSEKGWGCTAVRDSTREERAQPGERSFTNIQLEASGPPVPPSPHRIVGKAETLVLPPQPEGEPNTFINVSWEAETKFPGSSLSSRRPQSWLRFIPRGRSRNTCDKIHLSNSVGNSSVKSEFLFCASLPSAQHLRNLQSLNDSI